MESLRGKTIKGIIWSGIERFSAQGVHVLVMLVIARILTPKDFGLIGMLAIFIAVAQSLVDSGFSQALIRKQDRTEEDNSTVFYFNILVSVFLYAVLYVIAPWVADFYNEPQLCSLMRVLCIVIVINSFSVVQRALYTATIDFKTQAKATLSAAVISGGIGIWMAITGIGVWTLVWQQFISTVVNNILLWYNSYWRPKLLYSWNSFRELFSFGSKLMISGLIDTIYGNIYQLVIGKVFTAASLGHYSQAKTFAGMPSSNINSIIQRVTYPVLSSIQDDDFRLQEKYRKLLRMSAFLVFPMMCCLAGIAKPLVRLVVGEQWDYAAKLLVPICFNMMWYPIHSINLNLLQVKGRSDLFLKLEIIKKVIGVSIILLSIPFGLLFMCYSQIITSVVCLIINTYYSGKLIHVGFLMQMKDLSGTLFFSILIYFIVFMILPYLGNECNQVIIGVIIGAAIFLGMTWTFGLKEWNFLIFLYKK